MALPYSSNLSSMAFKVDVLAILSKSGLLLIAFPSTSVNIFLSQSSKNKSDLNILSEPAEFKIALLSMGKSSKCFFNKLGDIIF